MTRNSVKFYAISNETLFYLYDLTGFSYNSNEKSIFQNSGKLSPVSKSIHDFFFTPIILTTKRTIEHLKGR